MRDHRRASGDAGFSLVEFLVVILIVGVLVSIAVPALLRQRRLAYDAAVQEDVHSVAVLVTSHLTGDGGGLDVAAVQNEARVSPGTTVDVVPDGDGFCLRGRHDGTISSREWVSDDAGIRVATGADCPGAPLFVLP